ncbi:MAG: hypothetical protein ACRDQF_00455 [Thermocrispum sp.]
MEVINQAPAERAAAQAEPANLPAETAAYPAEIYAVIDSLGDVGSALADGMTVSLAVLYDDRRYEHEEAGAYVAAAPRSGRAMSYRSAKPDPLSPR